MFSTHRFLKRTLQYLSIGILLSSISYAEKVDVDITWPSVGPGSSGPHPQSKIIERSSVKSSELVSSPKSSIDPTGPKTPSVSLGFFGVNGDPKDGFFHKPPDTHMAVGAGSGANGRVVMVTNSGIQIWDKTGATIVRWLLSSWKSRRSRA